ncbi:hypothetical protein CSKR_101632 [Clonorchis sinensis]|uniref:SANT domain-containing protein n=2 Tax=Clonorchis sinensis TaxID=79923 RepID=A0A8T1M425_CLOSI|nr:hypothetical protein CSKR_101632 [Clonorchis sinensis]
MGDIYSKPEPGNPKPPGNIPAGASQNSRTREVGTNGSHHSGGDPLSGPTLEALSRIQGGNPQVISVGNPSGSRSNAIADQIFNSVAVNRGTRPQDTANNPAALSCALSNELLATAHLSGQFTAAQLNALVAACQQQQQQLQRSSGTAGNPHASSIPFAQTLVSASGIKPPPSSTPSLSSTGSGAGSVGGSSHASRSLPSHIVQATPLSTSHGHHQKRPSSGQAPFQSGHGPQSGLNTIGGRPPSASQPAQLQRNSLTGQPNFSHLHHSGHHNPPHHSHLDQNAATAIGGQNSLSGCRPQPAHHSQSGATASSSPGPVAVGYQGRRSQLAPPSTHSSKRSRVASNLPSSPQQQQHSLSQHGLSSLPATTHVATSTIATGMEAFMNTVAATKAMANLNPAAAAAGFLNPALYGSASEAAAVAAAFSPLFTAAISGGSAATAPSPNNLGAFPTTHYPGQHQRTPSTTSGNTAAAAAAAALQQDQQHLLPPSVAYSNPLLTGSLLNSMNHARNTYPHITATTLAHNATPSGSHQSGSHPSSAHLSTKPGHSASLLPMASRLPSGHLNHPHHYLAGHPAPHSFHSPPHNVPQGGSTPHHLLPQGSGVLRQQTKEPAYHPQVEAISPAPEESRLSDAQDAKIHREREELSRQLMNVEADLNKQRAHQRLLDEREARLTSRLASTGSSTKSVESKALGVEGQQSPKSDLAPTVDLTTDLERAYENPIQAFIAENRKRTRQHHLIFTRLCGPHVKAHPYALPLYRQPSDLPYLCAIRTDFRQRFRLKLVNYLRRRKKAEEARVKYLAQQYAHHSVIFTKKMEKLLNSTKQRHRELRYRDIFEKMHPEVKKNREDREVSLTDGVRPVVTEDLESSCQSSNGTLVDGTQTPVYDPVEEMNKMKEYAIDPPMPLAPWQRRYRFIYQSGLVTDCRAQLQEEHDLSKWTDDEKQIFRERFLATPKNFPSIASYLEGKTVAECIHYYYLSKKTERYKQLLKKHNARRRRAVPSDRGGGGNNNSSGGSNSNQNFPAPSSSGSFSTGSLNGNLGSSHQPPPTSGGGSGNGDLNTAPSDTVRETEHQKMSGRQRDTSSITGGRSRPGRGRPGTSGRQPPTTSADDFLSTTTTSCSQSAGTASGKAQSNFGDKVLDPLLSAVPSMETDGDVLREADNGVQHAMPTAAQTNTSESVPSDAMLGTEQQPIKAQLPSDTADTVTSGARSASPTPAPTSAHSVSSRRSPTTTLIPSSLSSTTDQGGMTCIKDLIHFAIEKNLTQPWTGRNVHLPSDSDRNTGLAPPPPNTPVCSPGTAARPITNPRTEFCSVAEVESLVHHRPPVDGTSELPKAGDRLSHKLSDSVNEQINHHFPSAPTADIYAVAAQIAAATGNSSELANAMYVAAAAAAAATVAVTGSAGSATNPTADRSMQRGSPLLTQFLRSSSPENMSHSGNKLLLSGNSDCRQSNRSSQLASSPANWTGPSSPTTSERNPSSKAILIGDFLTAQQLGTEDPSVTVSTSVHLDRTAPAPSTSHSRCIDPSTLPLPIGHSTVRNSIISPNLDRLSSRGGPPHLPAEEHTPSLSAERAAWFAFHAQTAIAAAAAAAAAAARTEAASSIPLQPFVAQPASPVVLPPLPHCSYSPLSPSPPKTDITGTPGKTSPVSSTWRSQADCSSAKIPDDQSAQLATFISNAQRRYCEEVEIYAKRDRSDSMRTLTSSEASRFVGALKSARQLQHQQPQHAAQANPLDPVISPTKTESGTSSSVLKRPRSSETIEDLSTTKRAHLLPSAQCLGPPSPEKTESKLHDQSPPTQRPRIFVCDELPNDSSMDPLFPTSAHVFRRRGYTESQINRRRSLPEVSQVESVPGDSNQQPTVSTQKDLVAPKPLNPVTYIDALIHSHLNRSSTRNADDTNSSVASNRNSPKLTSSGFGTRGSGVADLSNGTAPSTGGDTAQQKLPGFSRSGSTNTLEEQINKAITEEIRAQIHPNNLNSVVSNSPAVPGISTSISFPMSSTNPITTVAETVSSVPPIVPLKKRDRGCSLSAVAHPTKLSATLEPLDTPRRHSNPTGLSYATSERDNTLVVHSVDPNDSNGNKATSDTVTAKWLTISRQNGTRLPLDLQHITAKPNAIDLKVDVTPPKFCLPATSPNSAAVSTSPVCPKNSTMMRCVTPQKSTAGNRDDPPPSPCSSVGDLDSPGSLHIDLAASDFQPPIMKDLDSSARQPPHKRSPVSSETNNSPCKDSAPGRTSTSHVEGNKPITEYLDHPPVHPELTA